jgi:DNA-binding transcriptional LysR family regulator
MVSALSIALLKTLIAISDHGSFSAAAESVNVSQAAVGQQMKRLEASLHATLFDRTTKTPLLNPLAKALVPKARELVHAYDTLLDDLTGDAQLYGELTLGAVPSTIRALVPKSVKELVRIYPQLHIRVVPGLSGDMQEQVERGAVDSAILSQPSNLGSHLIWEPFADEELILLTSADVTEKDPLKILENMPYIRHTRRAAVGLLAEQWLSEHKVTVRASMEMESIESLTSMVSHNLGVSIVPNVSVPDVIFATLRKIKLPQPSRSRVLGVLSRADCSKRRLVDRLVEQLQITVAAHGGAE